jgi:hypothetical protein
MEILKRLSNLQISGGEPPKGTLIGREIKISTPDYLPKTQSFRYPVSIES